MKASSIALILGSAAVIYFISKSKTVEASPSEQTAGFIKAAVDSTVPATMTPSTFNYKATIPTKTTSSSSIYTPEQERWLSGSKPLTQSQIQSTVSSTIKATTSALKTAYELAGYKVTVNTGRAAVTPSLAKTMDSMYGKGGW